MITYFLKSATCLALLLAFYHFILEKEKMHTFNRFYLLGSVFFSFLAPLYIIYIDATPIIIETTLPVSNVNYSEFTATEANIEKQINYTQILIGIYLTISSILLLRFGRNLLKIINKIRTNTKVKYQKAKLVLVSDKILPHTFWNYIFINKNDYENQKIEQELFTHELTHVTQRHTLDVLILELIQIIFWINPFFILLKKAVQLNHEFLADETVIKQHKNTFQYQHLLLNTAAWKNEYYLASNLNYSLTKKRLLMMTTQSSQTKILLKKLAVIPLLTGFIFLFAERVEAQETIEIVEEIQEIEVVEEIEEISDEKEIYKEYYYKKLTFIRKDENGNKISKKYNELNDEEKARLIPPPSLKFKKIVPTKQQIEDLKDNSKYAIWIDGKVVKNEVLNNFKNTDFARYSNSHVYKNARSKRFPQENQAHLETTKYFENKNKKRIQAFKEYLEKEHKVETINEQRDTEFRKIINEIGEKYDTNPYSELNKSYEIERNKKPHFTESSAERQKVLTDLYSKLGSMYFKLSKENKKRNKRPIHPHHPYLRLMKNNKVFYKLKDELTREDELLIPPPPPVPNASKEQILKAKKAYEEWKMRTGNTISTPPPPISALDHVIKMAKKDATFYFEGTKITADKAIELLKNNKKLNIDTRNKDSEKPIVKISQKPITIERK